MTKPLPLEKKLLRMNEALLLGSLRQHELTEAAEALNARLVGEIAERKAAETALRKAEGNYHKLFDSIDEGFCIIERISFGKASDYRYIESNPAFEVHSGFRGVIGKTIRQILRREARGWCEVYDKVLETGRPKRFERSLGIPARTLELFAFRVEDEELRRVAVLFTDVTTRKLEEAIRQRLAVLHATNEKLENEIARRKILESELILSEQKEKDLRGRTRQLAHQVLHSQEQERLSISRELHDQVVQTLVGINTRLLTLTAQADHPGPSFLKELALAQKLVEKSVETVHEVSRNLRPALMDYLGFITSLRELLKGFLEETGIRARLLVYAGAENLNDAITTSMYRVAQEALSNVSRHANATEVVIRIEEQGGHVGMTIRDNGKGYGPVSRIKSRSHAHLGLIGMQERIEMVDGTFGIASEKGKGTTVSVRIPLNP